MSQGPLHVRIRQVVSSGIDTVVTAAEGVSGTALLREALRELDRAEESLRKDRSAAALRLDFAVADQKARRAKAAEMADNARYALGKDREDLATQAVAHQIDLEAEAERLATVQAAAKVDLRQLDEALAELTARRERMRKEIASSQPIGGSSGASRGKPSPQSKVDVAVARANQIFERATGSAADPLNDPATAKGLAEVAAMKRDDAIAERLDGLRQAPKRAGKAKR